MTDQIWASRLQRELQDLDTVCTKIIGGTVQLERTMFDIQEGRCKLVFSFSVPIRLAKAARDLSAEDGGVLEGKTGDEVLSPTSNESNNDNDLIQFSVEFDCDSRTRYPFDPPILKVIEGASSVPSILISNNMLVLGGDMEGWTPSNTIHKVLQSIVRAVKEAGALSPGQFEGTIQGDFYVGQTLHTNQLPGAVHLCRRILGGGGYVLSRYVTVTHNQLLELEAHPAAMNLAIVVECHPLASIGQLRFKRGHSMVIVFKDENIGEGGGESANSGTEHEYLMDDPILCVSAITNALKEQGITGTQKNMVMERLAANAKAVMNNVEVAKSRLEHKPELSTVKEIMDLYRQGAELYGAFDHKRAAEVIAELHQFLQQPDVDAILSGDPWPRQRLCSYETLEEMLTPKPAPKVGIEAAVAGDTTVIQPKEKIILSSATGVTNISESNEKNIQPIALDPAVHVPADLSDLPLSADVPNSSAEVEVEPKVEAVEPKSSKTKGTSPPNSGKKSKKGGGQGRKGV